MPDDLWKRVIADTEVRREVTRRDHLVFFAVYLSHYMKYETAPFQREMFAITEDERPKVAVIEAFRNSAKTTIMGMSYPIWAILGKQQRKFVVILAQTQAQARQYLANIKSELESNKLLRKDLGPFEEPDDEWRSVSIVLPRYGARITIASIDQSIRGLRHGPHRPDLIICDDLGELTSVRIREPRSRLFDWLMGDIIPLGDVRTRVIVIGTRLHEESLIMRLRKLIGEGKLSGIFTDTDLARLFEHRRDGELDGPICQVMTKGPLRVQLGSMMVDAVAIMAESKISELPVVDAASRPVGLIDITDVVALFPEARLGGLADPGDGPIVARFPDGPRPSGAQPSSKILPREWDCA